MCEPMKIKIQNMNTAWEISFNQNWSRGGAIEAIEGDLKKACEVSGIQQIKYALQLDIQLVIKSC